LAQKQELPENPRDSSIVFYAVVYAVKKNLFSLTALNLGELNPVAAKEKINSPMVYPALLNIALG